MTGPYGMCFRREGREGPVVLVGAGSGMSPVWSILNDHIASGEERPVYFFYGARTKDDLFHLDQLAAITAKYPSVEFIPVLSHAADDAGWDGERGFVHEAVDRKLRALGVMGQGDVYACGPPPMIDALTPTLFMLDYESRGSSSISSRRHPGRPAIKGGPANQHNQAVITKGGRPMEATASPVASVPQAPRRLPALPAASTITSSLGANVPPITRTSPATCSLIQNAI